MATKLFKDKVLPFVVKDVTNTLCLASSNSTAAFGLLCRLIDSDLWTIQDPKMQNAIGVDTYDDLAVKLANSVLRRGADAYPPEDLAAIFKSVGIEPKLLQGCENDGAYWAVYSYLFSLLPVTIRKHRITVNQRRLSLSDAEYVAIFQGCLEYWRATHGEELNEGMPLSYKTVYTASRSVLFRRRKTSKILKDLKAETVDRILESVPRPSGPARAMALRYALEAYVEHLAVAFNRRAIDYAWAKALGLFSNDPWQVPEFVALDSGEREGRQRVFKEDKSIKRDP